MSKFRINDFKLELKLIFLKMIAQIWKMKHWEFYSDKIEMVDFITSE